MKRLQRWAFNELNACLCRRFHNQDFRTQKFSKYSQWELQRGLAEACPTVIANFPLWDFFIGVFVGRPLLDFEVRSLL